MSMAAHLSPPPLRHGDRLSREEFLRRWEAMPELKRAELIDGIVYMPSPVSDIHSDYDNRTSWWLSHYAADTPGCEVRHAGTWLMAASSAPQPDLALKILPEYGGQSALQGAYASGAPELVAEISHTTSPRDTGIKLRLYERSGVREYLLVRPGKRKIAWYMLVDGKYQQLEPDADGIFRSRVFPGLWLNPEELWNRNYAGMAATIQRGTATPEHAAFAQDLAARKSAGLREPNT
jgi:Uma2 family endonuclease